MDSLLSLACDSLSIADILQYRGKFESEKKAFVFLRYGSGSAEAERLTYGALLDRALAVAAALQQRCERGDRTLILAPPGLDYIVSFFACMLAGVVAVPAYPPRNAKHLERLSAIAGDCGAASVLSVADLADKLWQWGAGRLPTAIAVDALPADAASGWRDPGVRPEDLAFLQYTSGTTGTPKGVMVGHENLAAMLSTTQDGDDWGATDLVVSWLPPYHDLGLIAGILQPLFSDFPAVLMAPASFLQEPARWLRALSDWCATVTLAPNFGYELAAAIGPELAASTLDLSSLRHAISGGEPPRAETQERFARRFAAAGFRPEAFRPGYGLAETTLQVTLARPGAPPRVIVPSEFAVGDADASGLALAAQGAVSNGLAVAGARVLVVDPSTGMPVPPGQIGAVWVGGPTVTRGYWNRPDETAVSFGARLPNDPGAGPFLRTGDLGALVDGELYVVGRIKELIIIRGRNLYPQDIEAVVAGVHPALERDSTIAFGVERDGAERLVIVHGLGRKALRGLEAPLLFAAIRRAVVEAHEVDPDAIVLVRPATLPRTTSGKLQRLKARAQYLADDLAVVARWSAADVSSETAPEASTVLAELTAAPAGQRPILLQRYLGEVVRGALGLAEPPGATVGFAGLGLDSLKAVQLGNRLNAELRLGPPLPATALFDQPNLDALTEAVWERVDVRLNPTRSLAVPNDSVPALVSGVGSLGGTAVALSWGQRRLWALSRLGADGGAYNIAAALRLTGALEEAALGQALADVLVRQTALRTVIEEGAEGAPVGRLLSAPPAEALLAVEDLSTAGVAEAALGERLAAEAGRAFDLGTGGAAAGAAVPSGRRDACAAAGAAPSCRRWRLDGGAGARAERGLCGAVGGAGARMAGACGELCRLRGVAAKLAGELGGTRAAGGAVAGAAGRGARTVEPACGPAAAGGPGAARRGSAGRGAGCGDGAAGSAGTLGGGDGVCRPAGWLCGAAGAPGTGRRRGDRHTGGGTDARGNRGTSRLLRQHAGAAARSVRLAGRT